MMLVESLVFAVADPPPEALTFFFYGYAALRDLLSLPTRGASVLPAASASLRVQVEVLHIHPVPAIPVTVKPVGAVSVIVTVPVVAELPVLETVTMYVAPD